MKKRKAERDEKIQDNRRRKMRKQIKIVGEEWRKKKGEPVLNDCVERNTKRCLTLMKEQGYKGMKGRGKRVKDRQ